MSKATIDKLYEYGMLSELDYRFAQFVGRLDGRNVPEVLLAAALVSMQRREGHICINLSEFADQAVAFPNAEVLSYPSLKDWLTSLAESPAIATSDELYRPLVLNGSLLYLYRYRDYEKNLADALMKLATQKPKAFDDKSLRKYFQELFPGEEKEANNGVDQRKIAAFSALRNSLCIISGGPGTGKTTTVARILALIIQNYETKNFRIALAAPTGKAATRLQESVRSAKDQLNYPDAAKEIIPEEASTVHRLLGSIPKSPYFRHDSSNPLNADCVVVDEASMIDLALFAKLVDALKPGARLILLGDKDQLASVGAGAVLGDICEAGRVDAFSPPFIEAYGQATGETIIQNDFAKTTRDLDDCIVELKKNYRFTDKSGIGALSRAVNIGDAEQSIAVLQNGDYDDLAWKALMPPERLSSSLELWTIEHYRSYFSASDPAVALETQNNARIFCALRDGPYGVQNINAIAENILVKNGFIKRPGKWYHGRPVMITKNDYSLGLFNGDIGIAMRDGEHGGSLKVFFAGADGAVRRFSPARLPDHETVFAVTVHKSQGSEFKDVLFILPDRDNPLLTRELIYTAVTRARERIEIRGHTDIFLSAVGRRIRRSSGLKKELGVNGGAGSG